MSYPGLEWSAQLEKFRPKGPGFEVLRIFNYFFNLSIFSLAFISSSVVRRKRTAGISANRTGNM